MGILTDIASMVNRGQDQWSIDALKKLKTLEDEFEKKYDEDPEIRQNTDKFFGMFFPNVAQKQRDYEIAEAKHKLEMAQLSRDTVFCDLEIEATKITNSRLREEVNGIIASNAINSTQAELIRKVILKVNFDELKPSEAFDLINKILKNAKENEEHQKRMAEEELRKAEHENTKRKYEAEQEKIKTETYQEEMNRKRERPRR